MDEPNFLKPKTPRECDDHAMWRKHLIVAHYMLLGVGLVIGIFTDRYLVAISLLLGSLSAYGVAIYLEIRHAKWHIKNDKEGKHS